MYVYQDSAALLEPIPYHGKMQLKLMFNAATEQIDDKTRGTLHVAIDNASYLRNMGHIGKSDSYVKIYLLPDKSKKGLRRTHIKRNNLNPVWNEKFVYEHVTLEKLKTAHVLEIAVLNRNILSKDDVLGCLRLGPSADMVIEPYEWMDSNSREAFHWEVMLKESGKWVELYHPLRLTMNIVEQPNLKKAI